MTDLKFITTGIITKIYRTSLKESTLPLRLLRLTGIISENIIIINYKVQNYVWL